jgi:polysaccharide export outer membrane protein
VKQLRTPSRRWPLALIFLLALTGAARLAVAQPAATIAPDDVLKISVYGNPDLATTTRVMQNGSITFPLIGQVTVGGVTTAEAESRIARMLNSGGFVRNAAVSVFVEQRSQALANSVTLLGQVGHSGIYSLDPQSPDGVRTLVSLLAKAGGPTEKAADYCYLIRNEKGQPKRLKVDLVDLLRNGNIKSDLALSNGDTVLVPEMDVFYIYGEVQRPGRYKLERDMTVMQGLSVASGITPRGNAKGIVLNRKIGQEITSMASALESPVQPNDVIYVKTAVF